MSASECPATRAGLALEDEFNALCAGLGGDVESRSAGDDYLATTHALYHGQPLSWAFTPKIFTPEGAAYLKGIAETMGRIMAKVTRGFREREEVRAAFNLPKPVEELCLIPTGYDLEIPLARVDIFLNERTGEFWFCELNTDGSAGMTSAVEVSEAISRSATWDAFTRRHGKAETFDVVRACARAILATYSDWEGCGTGGHPAERPVIGVVDYGESISADEVAHFVEIFREMGVTCRFSEIRELRVREGARGLEIADAKGPLDVVWLSHVALRYENRLRRAEEPRAEGPPHWRGAPFRGGSRALHRDPRPRERPLALRRKGRVDREAAGWLQRDGRRGGPRRDAEGLAGGAPARG